ncbi:hypothetical protein V6Z12_D02G035000 [Gossypium hirsutum]
MKCASKMSQREIILRDIKRFHHFRFFCKTQTIDGQGLRK